MKTYAAVVTALAITFTAGYVRQHDRAEAAELQIHCSDCYEKVEQSEVIPKGMVECSSRCFLPSDFECSTDTDCYNKCVDLADKGQIDPNYCE